MRSFPRQLRRKNASILTSCSNSKATTPVSIPPTRFLSSKPPLKQRPREGTQSPSQNIKHTFAKDTGSQQSSRARRSNKVKYLAGSIVVLTCYVANGEYNRPIAKANSIFDPPRFTPFQIINREEVSPTSIILTVRPPTYITNISSDPYEKWWKGGTWSVEVKQPQLQIARSYTPLPPRDGDADGDLRFLIRREHKGEVSGYLHRLQVGGTVDLRGPRTEIDLSNEVKEVVFLAGGTGIAPALQTIHTLFERRNAGEKLPQIRIVWANRRREDCVGGSAPTAKGRTKRGYIVEELESLQQKYPENLKVDYFVDEEGTFLDQRKISQITKLGFELKYGPVTTRIDSRLLILSGPEGFINHFAGPKKWEGGKEGQGELGGVLGAMRLRDWKVWKL